MPATAYYVNPGNSPFFEKHINIAGAGVTEYRHFIGGIAVYTQYSNASPATTKYRLKDHLGSTTVVTSSAGVVLERYSYDPFGRTRNLNGSDIPQSSVMTAPSTRRGFTDHEMLTEYIGGLIHMALSQPLNGRIYDPSLGRFMTADPNIQFAGYSQSYNRYSYTLNNPLGFTDPSGYGLRALFRAIDDLAHDPTSAQKVYAVVRNRPDGGAHDRYMMSHSWARAIGYGVAGWYGGSYAVAQIAGYEAYIAGGSNTDIWRTVAISYGTSEAFKEVGEASSAVGGFWGAVIKVGGSTAIGCASAEANGGSCRRGAIYAGVSAAASAYYEYEVGDRPTWQSGENPEAKWQFDQNDNLSSATNTFDPDASGRQPLGTEKQNVIGTNESLIKDDFWGNFPKQGGALSVTVNRIPGFNSFARLHDYWFNSGQVCCFSFTNIPSMIPALAINYSALISVTSSVELALGNSRRRLK